MKPFCGKYYKISEVFAESYSLEDTGEYTFTDEMLVSAGTEKDKVMKIDLCEIFGVKTDQVFHIKGSNFLIEDEYRVHEKVLQYSVGDSWIQSSRKINEFHDFEIVFHYATDAEKTILKSLDEKYKNGWIARDLCKDLYIYEKLPEKHEEYYASGLATRFPYSDLFQFIQFETGAIRIKDIIGE